MNDLTYAILMMLEALRVEIRAASFRRAGDDRAASALEDHAYRFTSQALQNGKAALDTSQTR